MEKQGTGNGDWGSSWARTATTRQSASLSASSTHRQLMNCVEFSRVFSRWWRENQQRSSLMSKPPSPQQSRSSKQIMTTKENISGTPSISSGTSVRRRIMLSFAGPFETQCSPRTIQTTSRCWNKHASAAMVRKTTQFTRDLSTMLTSTVWVRYLFPSVECPSRPPTAKKSTTSSRPTFLWRSPTS